MTRHTRPTAIQTTLGDLAGSLSEIYRTAGGSRHPASADRLINDTRSAMLELYGLEGSTPVDDGEPSLHPDLVPDRWKAIDEGHYDEYEPEGDE